MFLLQKLKKHAMFWCSFFRDLAVTHSYIICLSGFTLIVFKVNISFAFVISLLAFLFCFSSMQPGGIDRSLAAKQSSTDCMHVLRSHVAGRKQFVLILGQKIPKVQGLFWRSFWGVRWGDLHLRLPTKKTWVEHDTDPAASVDCWNLILWGYYLRGCHHDRGQEVIWTPCWLLKDEHSWLQLRSYFKRASVRLEYNPWTSENIQSQALWPCKGQFEVWRILDCNKQMSTMNTEMRKHTKTCTAPSSWWKVLPFAGCLMPKAFLEAFRRAHASGGASLLCFLVDCLFSPGFYW